MRIAVAGPITGERTKVRGQPEAPPLHAHIQRSTCSGEAKMTRDEAITALRKAQPRINTSENCSLWIDAFVALGMLKLDEPKNPEMHAGEIINEYVQDGGQTAAILMSLADAGLKIVAGYGYRSTGPSEGSSAHE